MRFRAPATTANIGPGFDCAGAALDLWNELELLEGEGVEIRGEGAEELDPDHHLGVRAFELVASTAGKRFVFTNRIPLASGLGSSAATIALGLVAACWAERRPATIEDLVRMGLALESHSDNLAAALAGGVCLTWDGHVTRIADTLPLEPVVVVPETRVSTASARASLPGEVSHADATKTAAHAVLLGAALATGNAELFAEALHDRLHEPFRAPLSPVYEAVGGAPEAQGVTISGSGPTVIAWTYPEDHAACAAALRERLTSARVLSLAVTPHGAGPA